RWVAAALILLALGGTAWFVFPTPQAQGAPDLVERLIDWNLELTQARTPEERGRIYEQHAAYLRDALRNATLPEEDGRLAEHLLATGSWLAEPADPIDEAERFHDMADTLLEKMNSATERQDFDRVGKIAKLYSKVAERGVVANLTKAERVAEKAPEKA